MIRRATGNATAGEFTGAEGKAADATWNIYKKKYNRTIFSDLEDRSDHRQKRA